MNYPNEKRNCYVKVILNPLAANSFSLRFETYPKKDVNLKIIIKSASDLIYMLDEIKQQIHGKYDFNVHFNWKNISSSIKENLKFQEDILKIFAADTPKSKKNNINMEYHKYAALLILHINQYGAAPSFENNKSEKNKLKIHNYIKACLGLPKLTSQETDIIAELVLNEQKSGNN